MNFSTVRTDRTHQHFDEPGFVPVNFCHFGGLCTVPNFGLQIVQTLPSQGLHLFDKLNLSTHSVA
jgi:hypothetical protein